VTNNETSLEKKDDSYLRKTHNNVTIDSANLLPHQQQQSAFEASTLILARRIRKEM
jgi:hypothetical protein